MKKLLTIMFLANISCSSVILCDEALYNTRTMEDVFEIEEEDQKNSSVVKDHLMQGFVKFLDRHEELRNNLIRVYLKYEENKDGKYQDIEDLTFTDKAGLALVTTKDIITDLRDAFTKYLKETFKKQKGKNKHRSINVEPTLLDNVKYGAGSVNTMVSDAVKKVPTTKEQVRRHFLSNKNAYIDFIIVPLGLYVGFTTLKYLFKSPVGVVDAQ